MTNQKEKIKKLNKEVKRLTLRLDSSNQRVDLLRKSRFNYMNENSKLREKAKDKDMYVKAFSVLLAAVNEKSLAWSLSKEYDNQKAKHEVSVGSKSLLSGFLSPKTSMGLSEERVRTEAKELGIDLDDIFKNFGLGGSKE